MVNIITQGQNLLYLRLHEFFVRKSNSKEKSLNEDVN